MATPSASLEALVHPHQIEVQEFRSYALIVDARDPEAFRIDHIPGAVNVPVGPRERELDEPSEAVVGVRDSEPVMPYVLASHTKRLARGAWVLVYCDRGGLDSLIWARPLRAAGFEVDVLPGGWGNYRRWVSAGLETVARALSFRVLVAPPVSGLSRIVARLSQRGQQVIDLTAIAGQRLVPGLTLDGDLSPSQPAFETALLAKLRRLDPRRIVWVRVSLCGMGALELPPGIREALSHSGGARVEVPLATRAAAWKDCLTSKGVDANRVLDAIASSGRQPVGDAVARWRALSGEGLILEALQEVITGYIEACRETESWERPPVAVEMPSLAPEAIASVVEAWCAEARQPSREGKNS